MASHAVPVGTFLTDADEKKLRHYCGAAIDYIRNTLSLYEGYDQLEITVNLDGSAGITLTTPLLGHDFEKYIHETRDKDGEWTGWAFAIGEAK